MLCHNCNEQISEEDKGVIIHCACYAHIMDRYTILDGIMRLSDVVEKLNGTLEKIFKKTESE